MPNKLLYLLGDFPVADDAVKAGPPGCLVNISENGRFPDTRAWVPFLCSFRLW